MRVLGFLLAIALVGAVVALNRWQRQRLARMSPKEKAADEEEQKNEHATFW